MSPLPNDALVCRGGTCTATRFSTGSGVTRRSDGILDGVSVNCAAAASLEALTHSIPNRQVGATTVGAVRAAGGGVTSAPTSRNPHHCVMNGVTATQAEQLFTPTVANPNFE